MARDNPLIALGVPKSVLVHERAYGTDAEVLKVAEANYRTLSKRYHPDLPTGNDVLMTALGDAIEELRDPDALTFYIDELVDNTDVHGLYLQQQSQRLMARDTEALSRVSAGLAFVDQFEILGITEPTSYLMALQGQRVVVDVLAPTRTRARTTDLSTEDNVGWTNSNDFSYRNGTWWESYLNEGGKQRWQEFTDFISDEQVRVVGFAPELLDGSVKDSVNPPLRSMIDTSVSQHRLGWQTAEDSWFLRELHYDREARLPRLVLLRKGRFATTDRLLGVAPFIAR